MNSDAPDDGGASDTADGAGRSRGQGGKLPSPAELERLRQTMSRLASSGVLEQLGRQQAEWNKSLGRSLGQLASSGVLEQLSRQQAEWNKSLGRSLGHLVSSGVLEQLGRQQAEWNKSLGRSLGQLASSGVLEQFGRQQTDLRGLFASMAIDPGLQRVRQQNVRIAALVGQLRDSEGFAAYERAADVDADPTPVPKSLPKEVGEAGELLSSVSEALSVEEGREIAPAGAGLAEVLAALMALIWVSGWIGFWLHEAVRTQSPALAEMNRSQLVMDLFFLKETTQALHERIRRFLLPRLSEDGVYFRDITSYAIVDALDQLHGPGGGVVALPHWVLWAPGGPNVDLDEPGGTALAYEAVLAEGTAEDLENVLNRDRLIEVWSELMLDPRVREMWESRFPELRRTPDAPPASGKTQ